MSDTLHFACKTCGHAFEYAPGTDFLECPSCHAQNPISAEGAPQQELDYRSYLAAAANEDLIEVQTVKCPGCGAESTLPQNVTSGACPFCSVPLQAGNALAKRLIRPQAVLPFAIEQRRAQESFRQWIDGLWFAPNALKKAYSMGGLKGVYLPYWTYDSDTFTQYHGQRGDDYYTTESYTTTENGQSVTRTRQVKHTRWSHVSGAVALSFDDVLVPASQSLPEDLVMELDPWPLEQLKPYTEAYLAGFSAEAYSVGLENGFATAQELMEPDIRAAIERDIGGDHQRIESQNTQYQQVSFKHILLPIWLASYRYQDKVYRFLVNGQSGEVQGERPWSVWKITFAVLCGLILAGLLFWLMSRR